MRFVYEQERDAAAARVPSLLQRIVRLEAALREALELADEGWNHAQAQRIATLVDADLLRLLQVLGGVMKEGTGAEVERG